MHTPIRTCVGCRRTDVKANLVRVVWNEAAGGVVVDGVGCAPGRGAYVHGDCVEAALRGRGLSRTLRRTVDSAQAREAIRLAFDQTPKTSLSLGE